MIRLKKINFFPQEFVKLDVYFQSLNVQTITQTPKYTVCLVFSLFEFRHLYKKNLFLVQNEGFFASLGGALSLYIGIAAIMVFEVLELALDLILVAVR